MPAPIVSFGAGAFGDVGNRGEPDSVIGLRGGGAILWGMGGVGVSGHGVFSLLPQLAI